MISVLAVRDVEARLDDRGRAQHVVVAAQEAPPSPARAARSAIWPWPTATRASGTSWRSASAASSIDSTRLWRKNDLAAAAELARGSPRARAPRRTRRRGCGSAGGRAAASRSRRCRAGPTSDMCSVRGIGVADIASTSTSVRSWRSSSFCATPKRCSSSTIDEAEVGRHDVARRARGGCRSGCRPCPRGTRRTTPLTSAAVAEARDDLDSHGQVAEAVAERLAGAAGRGSSSAPARAPAGRRSTIFERRAHRDLGLAEADVAADQPVHRPVATRDRP